MRYLNVHSWKNQCCCGCGVRPYRNLLVSCSRNRKSELRICIQIRTRILPIHSRFKEISEKVHYCMYNIYYQYRTATGYLFDNIFFFHWTQTCLDRIRSGSYRIRINWPFGSVIKNYRRDPWIRIRKKYLQHQNIAEIPFFFIQIRCYEQKIIVKEYTF